MLIKDQGLDFQIIDISLINIDKRFKLLAIINDSSLVAKILVKSHKINQFEFNAIKIAKNIMIISFIISIQRLFKIIFEKKIKDTNILLILSYIDSLIYLN